MPNPVSILLWRDARTDPPTKDWRRGVLVMRDDALSGRLRMAVWLAGSVVRDQGRTAPYWADEPVLSDLTDEDVLEAAMASADMWKGGPMVAGPTVADRLRAALGGEKEET